MISHTARTNMVFLLYEYGMWLVKRELRENDFPHIMENCVAFAPVRRTDALLKIPGQNSDHFSESQISDPRKGVGSGGQILNECLWPRSGSTNFWGCILIGWNFVARAIMLPDWSFHFTRNIYILYSRITILVLFNLRMGGYNCTILVSLVEETVELLWLV